MKMVNFCFETTTYLLDIQYDFYDLQDTVKGFFNLWKERKIAQIDAEEFTEYYSKVCSYRAQMEGLHPYLEALTPYYQSDVQEKFVALDAKKTVFFKSPFADKGEYDKFLKVFNCQSKKLSKCEEVLIPLVNYVNVRNEAIEKIYGRERGERVIKNMWVQDIQPHLKQLEDRIRELQDKRAVLKKEQKSYKKEIKKLKGAGSNLQALTAAKVESLASNHIKQLKHSYRENQKKLSDLKNEIGKFQEAEQLAAIID